MLIETVMTTKVICLPEGASVAQARKLMEENLVRSLPVVKDDMTLVGIITQRDVYAAGLSVLSGNYERGTNIFEANVLIDDLINRSVDTVTPKTSLQDAVIIMRELKIGALPVTELGKVVGIISNTDLLGVLASLLD